jgi:hypothetical protein
MHVAESSSGCSVNVQEAANVTISIVLFAMVERIDVCVRDPRFKNKSKSCSKYIASESEGVKYTIWGKLTASPLLGPLRAGLHVASW